MKRSITCVAWTLGSASLIALAVGCSRESRPPQPPTGTTSPTFESNVPPAPSPSGPSPSTREQPPGPGYESGAGQATPPPPPPPNVAGEPGAPPPGSVQRGTEQPLAAPTAENERQLCDALASGAKLHVEDVQSGAAIVAVPKAGHDIATVREDARHIEGAVKQRSESAPAGGDACGLFAIGRMPGVTTTVKEGPHSVRIVMTTQNSAEVRDVRRIAREQVRSLKAR